MLQTRNVKAKGIDVKPDIMIPLVGTVREFDAQEAVIRAVAESVFEQHGEGIHYLIGTMIETPRAALVADSIGRQAEFVSFGTNDLTQMTLGFSRDDAGKFLPFYLKKGIYERDPFQSIDQKGVGVLVQMAVEKRRQPERKSNWAYAANTAAIPLRNGVKITSQFDAILLPSSVPSFSLNSAAIRLKRYLADAKIIGLKLETYFDTVP